MAARIIMPQGGQTTDESRIVRWYKDVGDPVQRGDVLFDIETDKATLQVESHAKGVLLARNYEEGQSAATGAVVAYVGQPGEKLEQERPSAAPATAAAPEEDEYIDILPDNGAAPAAAPTAASTPAVAAVAPAGPIQASPKARKRAKELGIDLAALYAQLGRPVRFADVKAPAAPAAPASTDQRVPTGAMRRTIARRLTQSVQTAPQFTVTMELDMSAAKDLRAMLAGRGRKVAFHDIVTLCVCRAVANWPLVNALYGEEEITLFGDVNMGVAVGLEDGLVVPVVKGANHLSLAELAAESRRVIALAREGKLTPGDLAGGTMTLSNLGMYGVRRFDAILNPPESCILALGSIEDRPAVVDGQLTIRPLMTITATFDHRLVDGAYGAGFLQELKETLEDPRLLL